MNALAAELRENEKFGKLKVVQSIHNSEVLRGFVTVLNHCKNLKELDISNNGIDDIGAETLANGLKHCESLERIVIANNKMTSKGVNEILKSFKQFNYVSKLTTFSESTCLQSFSKPFRKCNLEIRYEDICQKACVTDEDTLSAVTSGTCLQSLILVKPLNSITYEFIGNCTCLQSLVLVKPPMDSTILCACLQSLAVVKPMIGSYGTIVRCLKVTTELQVLVLNGGVMDADDTRCLAVGLRYCCNLQILDLGENSIGDTEAQALFDNLKSCVQLKEISLQNNNIECKVEVLSWFQQFKKLQKLNLCNNMINRGGAKALASCLIIHCPALLVLYLDDNTSYWNFWES